MIQYRCACGRLLQADDGEAGQAARCPGCGAVSPVPGPDAEPRRAAESGSRVSLVLVFVGVAVVGLLACAGLVVVVLLPALGKSVAQMEEQRQLRKLGIAMHDFENSIGQFPRQAIESKEGKPLLSWRVAILPSLDEVDLFRQYKLDEPWDSDHNKQFIGRMPKVYHRQGEPPSTTGMTHFQAVVGKGLLFDNTVGGHGIEGGRKIRAITDGTSNTVMIVVAKTPVVWTKPEDVDGDDPSPLWPRLDTRFGGTPVLIADGSVRFLRGTPEDRLRAALTATGGEVLGLD